MKHLKPIRRHQNSVACNHEVWHECEHCGSRFDQRKHGNQCPDCGKVFNKKAFYFAVSFSFLLIICAMLGMILLSGCSTTKYQVRQHNNHLIQEVQQHQNSLNAREDWTRPYRNWDRRPHNHWPFNFLQ